MGRTQETKPRSSSAMRSLFLLSVLAIMICARMGGLVKRGADADPEAAPLRLVKRDADAEANPEADPHRRRGGHHRYHGPSYYRPPSYAGNYYGYNNYNNNRRNTPIRDLLPLKAAALAGAVGGFKVASLLG